MCEEIEASKRQPSETNLKTNVQSVCGKDTQMSESDAAACPPVHTVCGTVALCGSPGALCGDPHKCYALRKYTHACTGGTCI